VNWLSQSLSQQDHKALLEAKYCPRVAAASCTQKKTPCDFNLIPMTLKFNRILEVVEVRVRAKCHRA